MGTVTRMEVMRLRLRGKVKCPHCRQVLSLIYEGASGYTGEKCKRCRQEYLVNMETLETVLIEEAG